MTGQIGNTIPVTAVTWHPAVLSRRSGMTPLIDALGADAVYFEPSWDHLLARSWSVGTWIRNASGQYYGSTWNSLLPWIDEWRLSRRVARHARIVHFVWGEFCSPVNNGWFRRRGRRLVGTFHASAGKLPVVLKGSRAVNAYDHVVLMSETQRPFFRSVGYRDDQISVLLHGVDTGFFTPQAAPSEIGAGRPLRGLLVGKTERDHVFMRRLIEALPPDVLEMTVLTSREQASRNYQGMPHLRLPGHLDDEGLLAEYRRADLLIMPMNDCTANNAVLEAMSCGTPVLTNRVGGIPEYVSAADNFVQEGKDVEAWAGLIRALHQDPSPLLSRRAAVRAWAERFDWRIVAGQYVDLYRALLASPEVRS